jgi:undecaprenyl-diphosphatase
MWFTPVNLSSPPEGGGEKLIPSYFRLPTSDFPLPEQEVNPCSKKTSKTAWKFQELDGKLLEMVESQNRHPVLDYTLETVSLISPFIEGGLTLERYVKAYINQDKSLKNISIIAAAALIGTQIVNVVLKYAVARDRPNLGVRNYRPRILNTKLTPSFPSGHTASSFAFANIMGTKYAKYKVCLIGYAGLSGYSQMYVGNHYPSDVFVGALLGYSISEATLCYETVIIRAFSFF